MKYTNIKIVFVALAFLISLSFIGIIQSCSNDFDATQIIEKGTNAKIISANSNLEYLDLDIENLKNPTDEQKVILQKAIDRIDPYVFYENKKYKLRIQNRDQLQISEQLINFFEATIKQTNLKIKDLNLVSDKSNNKKLHFVSNANLKYNIRMKVDGEGSNPPPPPTPPGGVTKFGGYTWYGFEIFIKKVDLEKIALGFAAVAFVGTFTPEPALSKAAACIGELGAIWFQSHAVLNPNGIKIQFYGPFFYTVNCQ